MSFEEACANFEANPLREDIRNLGASVGESGATGAAIAACGIGQTDARHADDTELAPYREAMDEVARQVAERAGIPASLLTSASATSPQVAPKDPHVGWFRRMFRRGES